MGGTGRYFRLFAAFARFGLVNEMAFRANFLIKLLIEVVWLSMMLIFYATVFRQTDNIAGWSEDQFLCFLGCYFALEGVIETFFLSNCNELSDLVRTGNLDLYLLKPIDEQFLITTRKIEWSSIPTLVMGFCLIAFGLSRMGWPVSVTQILFFLILFVCGAALAYSFLLMLSSTSVWLVRNQSLMELWWLSSTLMRYPRRIYTGPVGSPMRWVFSYILPIMLVVNVPAETIAEGFESSTELWWTSCFTLVATVVLLWLSRRFFRFALQSYRSASS